MNKKYVYMLIFLSALIGLVFVMNSASAVTRFTTTLGDTYVLEDGSVDDSNTIDKNDDKLVVKWASGVGDESRAYVLFNISSLPANAEIRKFTLNMNVISSWTGNEMDIWDLGADPRTNTGAGIRTDCINGTLYEDVGLVAGNRQYILEKVNVSERMTQNITRGWFGFGFDAVGPLSWAGGRLTSSEDAGSTRPSLTITYVLNSPVVNDTLTTPADKATNVNITPNTCINISHPSGNKMNISWSWYNEISGKWEQYAFNGTDGFIEDFENYTSGNDPNADWYTYEEWKTVNGPVIANVTDNPISLDDQSMLIDTSPNDNKEEQWAFNFTEAPYSQIDFAIYPRDDTPHNRMTFLFGSIAQPLGFGFWFQENNDIEVYNDAPWTDTGKDWHAGMWYNISIRLNYTTHKFLLIINGTEEFGWYNMKNNVDKFHSLWMYDSANTIHTNMFLDNFALNASYCNLVNGTYCQEATFATEPCTTYYWSVDIYDENHNLTSELYEFKTHCVNAPSGVSCKSPNPTTINVTFTKDSDAGGTTYTEMYYQHGSVPPNYGGGKFAGNTTDEYFNITGLDQGQCYAYSLWTIWNAPDGRWYRSSTPAERICCAAGGDYWAMFFDEETREPLNFSKSPWNLTTFALKVHYYDSTEDTFYISNDSSTPKIWRDTNVEDLSFVNISATHTVWYFELIVNYDYNYSGLLSGESSRTRYKRMLTPYAAIRTNITTLPWDAGSYEARDSLYFYVANLTTYGANYWYNNGSSIYQITDTDYENSVIKYEYSIYDTTGKILSEDPNKAFITIYERNITTDIIIHQEYIDSSGKINPALIYEKEYLLGANSSTYNVTNFGIAPTDTDLSPTIIIRSEFSDEELSTSLNITWTFKGDYLNITYKDTKFRTSQVRMYLYENTTNSTPVETFKSGLNTVTFSYNKVVENATYIAIFEVNITDTIEGNTYSTSFQVIKNLYQRINDIVSGNAINNLIVGIAGTFPVPGMTWIGFIVFMISMFIMLIVIGKAGPVAGFLAGAFTIGGISALVADLSAINYIIAVILGTLGMIILIANRGLNK